MHIVDTLWTALFLIKRLVQDIIIYSLISYNNEKELLAACFRNLPRILFVRSFFDEDVLSFFGFLNSAQLSADHSLIAYVLINIVLQTRTKEPFTFKWNMRVGSSGLVFIFTMANIFWYTYLHDVLYCNNFRIKHARIME